MNINPKIQSTPELLIATFQALNKWLYLYQNSSLATEPSCSLCTYDEKLARKHNYQTIGDCFFCPIQQLTSKPGCSSTPYSAWARLTDTPAESIDPLSLQIAAFTEYQFLWSLLFDYGNLQKQYNHTLVKNKPKAKPGITTYSPLTFATTYIYEDNNTHEFTINYLYYPEITNQANPTCSTSAELEILDIQTKDNISIPHNWIAQIPDLFDLIEATCWEDAENQYSYPF